MNAGNEWTAAMIDRLRELHEDPANFQFRDIAAKMSAEFGIELTRNACIGKARRIGLPMREGTPRQPVKGKEKMMRKRVDAPIIHAVERPLDLNDTLTIYQLREGDCKWPLGGVEDKPPYAFCGHPAPIGTPYCLKHAKKAYSKPWER
jgi:hypothetical protein